MSEATKIFGLTAQIDFGNLAVGLATIFVAFVALLNARQSEKIRHKHKIVDIRNENTNRLIDEISNNIKLKYKISILKRDRERNKRENKIIEQENIQEKIQDIYASITESKTKIRLLIDDSKYQTFDKILADLVEGDQEKDRVKRRKFVDEARKLVNSERTAALFKIEKQ